MGCSSAASAVKIWLESFADNAVRRYLQTSSFAEDAERPSKEPDKGEADTVEPTLKSGSEPLAG
jgi:hypothetical protein